MKSNFYIMIGTIAKKKSNDLNCHIKTSLKVELKSILASFVATIPIRSFKR